MKRIATQPIVRAIWTNNNFANSDENFEDTVDETGTAVRNNPIRPRPSARLYPRPQNLYDLWHEYEFGLSGNKPAKHFTRVERGKVKYAYCRRKVFWDVIAKLINAGHTSDSAVDEVYNVYGRSLGVTTILRKMVNDRKTGGHINLQI